MRKILRKNDPCQIGNFYCYFDDFPYDIFLPEEDFDKFNKLYVSDHILNDEEFAELEQLAEKAWDLHCYYEKRDFENRESIFSGTLDVNYQIEYIQDDIGDLIHGKIYDCIGEFYIDDKLYALFFYDEKGERYTYMPEAFRKI